MDNQRPDYYIPDYHEVHDLAVNGYPGKTVNVIECQPAGVILFKRKEIMMRAFTEMIL